MKSKKVWIGTMVLALLAAVSSVWAVDVGVTRTNPEKTVNLPRSHVKGSATKSVANEERTLSVTPSDPVVPGSEYGAGTGSTWTRSGLTMTGIQLVDKIGTFSVHVGGTAQPKGGGKGGGNTTTDTSPWNFKATGNYGVSKCPNAFSKNTSNVAWDSAGKNLVGWNKSADIQYVSFSCPVDSSITWQDVDKSLPTVPTTPPQSYYGYFNYDYPDIITPKSIKQETECSQCHTNNFLYEEYLLDWKFFDTEMVAAQWIESSSSGQQTQMQWSACIAATITHENSHRNDFKSCVLDFLKPLKFKINVCNHNDQKEFSNRSETIRVEIQNMNNNALKMLENAKKAYIKAEKKVDDNDNGPFMHGSTSVED